MLLACKCSRKCLQGLCRCRVNSLRFPLPSMLVYPLRHQHGKQILGMHCRAAIR